ncbi:MAG: rRNA maturation RNase YbeY [Deltaproteobacteria bacterium]|jgi:probable rRNA maturation factor|nr:rRNA maturation RNase YbeY [Deltaproteobacteria bacterium]
MDISISGGPRLAWRLPFSATELADILQLMCAEFMPADTVNSPRSDVLKSTRPDSPCGDQVDLALEFALGTALELALVDDAQMSELNQNFLGCAGPTNVLAFPASPGCGALGWLALSPQTVRREARLFRQALPAYTLRLLAHGLGHLFGYDHGAVMDTACSDAVRAVSDKYICPGSIK